MKTSTLAAIFTTLSFELCSFILPVHASPLAHHALDETSLLRSRDIPIRLSALSHLSKRDGSALEHWALRQKRTLERRYAAQREADQQSLRTRKRDSRGQEEMWNLYSDTEYFAEIDLGTPSRTFSVVLDTGSADLWVAGSTCTSSSGCHNYTELYGASPSATMLKYDTLIARNATSASSAQFNVSYGSGDASGSLVADTVSMAGYTVANQTFASVSHVTPGLISANVSGIMGLGFQDIAASGAMPFWQAIAENRSRSGEDFEMGFAFTRFLHAQHAGHEAMPGGILSFGQRNASLFSGELAWNSLTGPGYWMIALDAVAVNGQNVGVSSQKVAIDTGTSLIGGPAAEVAKIFAQIPGAQRSSDPKYQGYHTFPCSSPTNVSLTFGGVSYPISSADFNLGRTSDGSACLGAIFSIEPHASDTDPEWVLGAAFLKNVYSVFRFSNPRAVGFARLSSSAQNLGAGSVGAQAAASAAAAPPSSDGRASVSRLSVCLVLVLCSIVFIMST